MVARLRTGDKVRINSALIPRLPARLAAGKTRRTSGTPSGETALGNSIRSHVVLADDNAPTNRRFSRILANCSLETSEVMVNCFTETIKVKGRLSALTMTRLLQLLRSEFLTSANKASSFGKKIKRKNKQNKYCFTGDGKSFCRKSRVVYFDGRRFKGKKEKSSKGIGPVQSCRICSGLGEVDRPVGGCRS